MAPTYPRTGNYSSDDNDRRPVPQAKRPALAPFPAEQPGPSASGIKKKRPVSVLVLSSDDDDDDDEPALPRHRPGRVPHVSAARPAPLRAALPLLPTPPPPPPPAPEPEPEPVSQEDQDLASIVAIIPDVAPAYALTLLQSQKANPDRVGIVLEVLFSDDRYPRADKKEAKDKRKPNIDDDDGAGKQERDWTVIKDRPPGGAIYEKNSLAQLHADFDTISQNHIRKTFAAQSSFYAPTFFALRATLARKTDAERGFKLLESARAPSKGKGKESVCIEFECEHAGVQRMLQQEKAAQDEIARLELLAAEEVANGEFFECGCCFSEFGFSQLVTCTEGCQFCRDCSIANANNQVGMRKYVLPCMSTDGCKAFFPEAVLETFLPTTTLTAIHKLRQEQEVDLARLDGLAKCPFCPFACVIENDQERLFFCQREDCQKISCLKCQRDDHLPRSCEEMDMDKKIDGLHVVEEAMSAALIRKCPSCNNPYMKENGCNKIVCPTCHKLSCYICRKEIVVPVGGSAYSHFANPGTNGVSMPGAVCPLWDDQNALNYQEVERARLAASALVTKSNAAVLPDDLKKLHLPAPPPPPAHLGHLAAPGRPHRVNGPPPVLLADQPGPAALVLAAQRMQMEEGERRMEAVRMEALRKRNEALARAREQGKRLRQVAEEERAAKRARLQGGRR